MSDETRAALTDFDSFLQEEYRSGNPHGFTLFAILVKITRKDVTPVCSTYMHVIGNEIDWAELTTLFAGSGMKWDAVALFPKRDPRHQGPLDNPTARLYLMDQEARISDDRMAINEGHFFDVWGRRMKVEESSI